MIGINLIQSYKRNDFKASIYPGKTTITATTTTKKCHLDDHEPVKNPESDAIRF